MALIDFDPERAAQAQAPGSGAGSSTSLDAASHGGPESISRREAIRRVAALMGGVVFAPTLAGALQGCTARPGAFTPQAFNAAQLAFATSLMDTILPRTDTPSASEAGVPAFLDELLARNYSDEQRTQMLSDLDAFAAQAGQALGVPFQEADQTARADYFTERLREDLDTQGGGFALRFKEAVMMGYFTSEAGATQVLRYIAIPGKQEGCIPFEQVGRTWAT